MAVLGLDIGGANLKAATPDRRAVSVPFALWKQPDGLPAALAGLVAKFPDATELAVTMTGELCDCYETKRQGVNAILDAAEHAAAGRPVRVWGTGGEFVDVPTARRDYLVVAAANWHALATFAGRYSTTYTTVLVDVGSTTTDIIRLTNCRPDARGATDQDRLAHYELVYLGVRRTPVYAAHPDRVCAELFATTQDVYVVLEMLPEDPADRDTADGRPLIVDHSLARLARMLGGDRETLTEWAIVEFATRVHHEIVRKLADALCRVHPGRDDRQTVILAGAGEFLARRAAEVGFPSTPAKQVVSLNDELGPTVSACAPAYAVAVLAAERRP